MKQLFIIAWACLLVGTAQAQHRNKTRIGFFTGLNICHAVYVDYHDNTKFYLTPLVLYHVGIQADKPMTRRMSILTELVFNRIGLRVILDDYAAFGKVRYDQRASYIELPIMAKISVQGFGIYAGPKLGVLVSAQNSNQYAVNGPKWQDARQDYHKTALSAVGGIEYTHKNGLGLYVRLTMGISKNLKESAHDGPYPYPDMRLRAFQTGIHYRI